MNSTLQILVAFLVVSAQGHGGLRDLTTQHKDAVKQEGHMSNKITKANAAVQHDISNPRIVWEPEGARGDSRSWAKSHEDKKLAAAAKVTADKKHAAAAEEAKKNTLTNHDGEVAKVAQKVPDSDGEPKHQRFGSMTVVIGLCAGLVVVGVAMRVKLRMQASDTSATDAAVPMASTLPSDSLPMTTADTKGAFL